MIGIIAYTTLMVVLVGAMLAATPFLMPATECFTVSVPPSARRDPRIRVLTRGYVAAVLALTGVAAAATAWAMARLDAFAASLVLTLATLALPVAGFALMLRARCHVRDIKEQEGWAATTQQVVALVGDEQTPRPLPLAWESLQLVVVVALAAVAVVTYDQLPDRVPMNIELDGSVSTYANKSWGVALFPAAVAAFVGIVMTISHASILWSKRPVDPSAPASSAYAYGRFARVHSFLELVGGLTLNVSIGVLYFVAALGIAPLDRVALILTGITLAFVAAALWIAVYLGQSGARLANELRTSDELARDDDRHWPLGIFYANREDPAIVVPKRFGIGWTINVAQPVAWLMVGGIAVATAVFGVLVTVMMG